MKISVKNSKVKICREAIACAFAETSNVSFDLFDERCCYCPVLRAFYLKHIDKIDKNKEKNDLISNLYLLLRLNYHPVKNKDFDNINDKATSNLIKSIPELIKKSKAPEIQKAFLFAKISVYFWELSNSGNNNIQKYYDKRCYTCPILVEHMKNQLKQQARINTIELKKLRKNYHVFINGYMSKKLYDIETYQKINDIYQRGIARLECKKSQKQREEEWLKNYQSEQDKLWEIRRPKSDIKTNETKNYNKKE